MMNKWWIYDQSWSINILLSIRVSNTDLLWLMRPEALFPCYQFWCIFHRLKKRNPQWLEWPGKEIAYSPAKRWQKARDVVVLRTKAQLQCHYQRLVSLVSDSQNVPFEWAHWYRLDPKRAKGPVPMGIIYCTGCFVSVPMDALVGH